jgi:RNA recognition motif-containing protein
MKPHKIVSHRILRDDQGQSRGVAFARMENREDAEQVIQKLHGSFPPTDPSSATNEPRAPMQLRFADTFAQKTLKQYQRRFSMASLPEQEVDADTYGDGINL